MNRGNSTPCGLVSESVNGAVTPTREVERAVAVAFGGARFAQLVFSGAMLAGDRHRYRRPRVQLALYAAAVAESTWLATRVRRSQGYVEPGPRVVDTAFSSVGLLACEAGLGDSGAPWMKNVTIGSALGAGAATSGVEAAGSMAALMATAILAGRNARGRDRHVAGWPLGANDALSWLGTFVAARAYVTSHRRFARLREEAGERELAAVASASAAAERARQQRRLHRVTVRTLRALAACEDIDGARAVAAREAGRLRHLMHVPSESASALVTALLSTVESLRDSRFPVEFVAPDLEGSVLDERGVSDAVAAVGSLLRAARDASADRAVVRIADDGDDDALRLVVRVHGCAAPVDLRSWRDGLPAAATAATFGDGVRVVMTLPRPQPPTRRPQEASAPPGAAEPMDVAEAEGVIRAAFLTWRATGLVTGLASVVGGRGRHRSSLVATMHLSLAAYESWWLAGRLRRRTDWYDGQTATLDAAAAALALVAEAVNLERQDRWTWISWVPWSFAANVVTGQAMGAGALRDSVGRAGAVVGTCAVLAPSLTDAVATGSAMTGFFLMGRVFAAQVRDGARRLVEAQAAALAARRRSAAAHERLLQLRLLHDGAVQTLEAVRGLDDLDRIREAAAAEADRLIASLAGHSADAGLGAALAHVVEDARTAGMTVEFRPVDATLPGEVVEALCGATAEALTNVRKHAGTLTAVVSATVRAGAVSVSICDEGIGFDAGLAPGGFGTRQSIVARLAETGGRAAFRSAPGSGTAVTLTWHPARD